MDATVTSLVAGPTTRRVLCVAHLAPLRSALKHTLSTLTFVYAICTRDSRTETESKNFNGPSLRKAVDCIAFVARIEGGKYAALPINYAMTGKMFSVE